MALHMQVMVNDRAIGFLYITRRYPVGQPDADTMCHYDWRVDLEHGETLRGHPHLPVAHRYGDGPWTLITRVLTAAGYAAAYGGTQT